ncbi:hypothetical protein [Sporolactobacillus shoreicorticis]|uniref:Uncharacterized protein n=1 Tax=Sporolactobacillus shoreicorticis TaxID=1923877 RepID=A0ABW5S414_9BACL
MLSEHCNKVLAVGSHGTALSTIINHYDSAYGFEDFEQMKHLMPWIVKLTFDHSKCKPIETIDLFTSQMTKR